MGKLARLPCRGNLARRGLWRILLQEFLEFLRAFSKFIHKKIIRLNDDGGLLTIQSGRQVEVALRALRCSDVGFWNKTTFPTNENEISGTVPPGIAKSWCALASRRRGQALLSGIRKEISAGENRSRKAFHVQFEISAGEDNRIVWSIAANLTQWLDKAGNSRSLRSFRAR